MESNEMRNNGITEHFTKGVFDKHEEHKGCSADKEYYKKDKEWKTMVKKLKSCPKCMGTLVALQTDKAHEGLWQGACMKCGKIGPWCKSQLEAIDAWNTL